MYLDLLPLISDYWLKPMLGLGLVLLVMRRPAFRSAAYLHCVFLLSLFAVVLATLWIPALPELELNIVPESWVQQMRLPLVGGQVGKTDMPWLYSMAAVYLLGLSWCASYTYASWRAAAKLTQRAKTPEKTDEKQLNTIVSELAQIFRLKRKSICFALSDDIQSPLVWKWRSPIIVLPVSYRLWTADRLRRVLAHELAHIERNDWISKIVTRIICIFAWPLPFVWLISKKINWYAEVACDDRVIELLNCRGEYADDLLSLATDQKLSVFALSYLRSSELYQRINMVLDPCRMKNSPNFYRRVMLFLGLTLGFIPIAATQLHAVSSVSDIWYPYPIQVPLLVVPTESPIADGNDRFAWNIRQQFLQSRGQKAKPVVKDESASDEIPKSVAEVMLAPPAVRADEEFVVTAPIRRKNGLADGVNQTVKQNSIHVLSPAVSIRGYIPTKIVTPRYPHKALKRNITGRVVVRFDVNEDGHVTNPEVVETTSGKIFNRTVLEAIAEFRFTPLSLDGVPVITKNVHETFVFSM